MYPTSSERTVFWDSQAENWVDQKDFGQPTFRSKLLHTLVTALFPLVQPHSRGDQILDLGSGSNNSVYHRSLRLPLDQLIRLDLSHQMLSISRQQGESKALIQADAAENLPFADASFGLVTSFFMMRYLPLSAYGGLMAEPARITHDSGRIAVVDVSTNGYPHQHSIFSSTYAKKLAERVGFAKTTSTEIMVCDSFFNVVFIEMMVASKT